MHVRSTEMTMNETMTMHGLTVRATRPIGGSRPPVLFIHGMFGGAWYWESYQRFFTARGYPTCAINLRGHHDSRPVADIGKVSVREYVADALQVAHTLGRPIVIGHSMGGLIAQRLAEENAVIAAVLLCSTPPRWVPPLSLPLLSRMVHYLPELLFSKAINPSRADADFLMYNRVPVHERDEQFAKIVPESGCAGFEMTVGAIGVNNARVQCPVLSVSAEDDNFLVPRIGRAIARKYHAKSVTYTGHAHSIMLEPGWEKPATDIATWLEDELGLDTTAA